MKTLTLAALLVGAVTFANAQAYHDIVFNRMGQPKAGASIAVCSANPGSATPPCTATLVQTKTSESGLVNCTLSATTASQTSGTGCTMPGISNGLGNYNLYIPTSGLYWVQVYGSGITTQVFPIVIPTTATSFVDLTSNQTIAGTKLFQNPLKLQAVAAPTCLSGFAFIWEDSGSNTLKFCNHGGAATDITGAPFSDATSIVKGSADSTKQVKITATGNTGGITGTIAGVFTTAKTVTLPDATDTLVGKATTDTLTNKTFDTAGAGNSFKINGQAVSSVSGNTSKVATTTGTLTSANCASFDASGNIQDSGTVCGASGYQILNKQDVIAGAVGDGTDKTIYTYSMPSGTLAAGKCLRITYFYQRTAGAGSPAFKTIFGGTTLISNTSGSAAMLKEYATVCNNGGSTVAQWGSSEAFDLNGVWNSTVTTPAENTNSGSPIVIKGTFNVAAATSAGGKGWIVEMLP